MGRKRVNERDLAKAEVEQIVRRAACYLSEAVLTYWPSLKKNEIPERNAVVQLGRAFGERSYQVYAECNLGDSNKEHIDLFALNLSSSIQVAVEAKKLDSTDKLRPLVNDRRRVSEFWPANLDLELRHKLGVLVATTWRQDIADWWTCSDGKKNPTEHPLWDQLYDGPEMEDSTWGRCQLNGYAIENQEKNTRYHYLLYAIFDT
jgi:hypothetical protein